MPGHDSHAVVLCRLISARPGCGRSRRRGHGLLKRTIALSRRARACLARIPGVGVMGREIVGRSGVFDLDETKVVVDVQALNLSGFAADWLIHECDMPMELADHRMRC